MHFEVLTPRENRVISCRYEEHKTLQKCGDEFGVSRERIRQIEEVAKKKLQKTAKYNELKDHVKRVTKHIKEAGIERDQNIPDIYRLAWDICPECRRLGDLKKYYPAWVQKDLRKQDIDKTAQALYREMKRIGRVFKDQVNDEYPLFKAIMNVDRRFARVENGFALKEWRWVVPKFIDDYIEIVFREDNGPLHFTTITSRVNVLRIERKRAKVSKEAVHNALLHNDQFVLVGRGLYSLRKAGMIEGKVADVIYEILKRNGSPMTKNDIIQEVSKYKRVRNGTVAINLQKDSRFKRVGRGVYCLA